MLNYLKFKTMKKLISIISIFILLVGCNSDKKTKTTPKISKKSEYIGSFKATINDGE
jgi:PBP1b-binding outer membrane lipoprotein LpoB